MKHYLKNVFPVQCTKLRNNVFFKKSLLKLLLKLNMRLSLLYLVEHLLKERWREGKKEREEGKEVGMEGGKEEEKIVSINQNGWNSTANYICRFYT